MENKAWHGDRLISETQSEIECAERQNIFNI